MSLYVGTNYHPHDWPEDRWPVDIELMKRAGFSTVRLGHLCWDSYEPDDGQYSFEWFDKVMDLFAEAGMGVVLDISMRPAPRWVHKLCPGCDIYGKGGTYQASLTRYMEDVSDPAYQHYALRFAKVLVECYKDHPALFAFGLCNEQGDGFMSHSEYARLRFINWLKKKYVTIDALNESWTTRRWSRRLGSFDDVELQQNELAVGSPEAWLDMRRFYSDGVGEFISSLAQTVETHAPGIPHSSNHYASRETLGFDSLKYSERFVDYPGIGIYPGYDPERTGLLDHFALEAMCRINETGKPLWCLEFQSGRDLIHNDYLGKVYMYAMYFLLHRAQLLLGWTWRSMLGGEEQFHHGILDHDGTPTRSYDVYRRIAADYEKLSTYGFPYLPTPEIALAYSQESELISRYHVKRFTQSHKQAATEAVAALEQGNRDYNVVDLRSLKRDYKLLIIAGHVLMDEASASAVRKFVEDGGTAIMTANSAIMDETAKVFGCPKPGLLSDVFGVRNAGFFCADMAAPNGYSREDLSLANGLALDVDLYEELELRGADRFIQFAGKDVCAVSVNQYGAGKAYYVACESNAALLNWLINELGFCSRLKTPVGVIAREIAPDQHFYVNMMSSAVEVTLAANGKGVLTETVYCDKMVLPAYKAELVVSDI